MRAIKPILWFLIALVLAALVLLVWRGAVSRPVTLRLISATNDSTGAQSAYFCLSNRTKQPVVFLGDATGLPYYHLTEALPIDVANRVFLMTNYNQSQFFTCKPATLPPGGSVTFPVHVPSGANGAIVQLSYLRQKGSLEEMIRALYLRVRGRSSEAYQPIDVRQPFAEALKQ